MALNIFLLNRTKEVRSTQEPVNAFVIAANNEKSARQIAAGKAADERAETWFNMDESTCVRVGRAASRVKAGVILCDRVMY